jgi:protein involved in polysaccharide export with SLBB domain
VNSGEEVILEEGDELHVPRREHHVYLSGQVRRPGAYRFRQGWKTSDYIKEAGGITSKGDAKNLLVVTQFRQAIQITDKSKVSAGEIIVVPTSIEYKDFTSIYLPMTQVTVSILSLVLSIIAISR